MRLGGSRPPDDGGDGLGILTHDDGRETFHVLDHLGNGAPAKVQERRHRQRVHETLQATNGERKKKKKKKRIDKINQ